MVIALVPTVLLLVSLGFFILGSIPLLILKHDVPMDSRFIRGTFHWCYRFVTVLAAAAALGFAFAGRPWFSAGFASIAVLAVVLCRWLLERMDVFRRTMHDGDAAAISAFRKLHVGAIALNVTQLGMIAAVLIKAL